MTATTSPAGKTVTLTYSGSSTAPVNAGNYAMVGTIVDANYQGTKSATLAVARAAATVTLSNLSQVYNGSPRPASATTTPAGLAVGFTYNGSSTAPTAAAAYAVVGTINAPNHQGSASGTLVINKIPQTITFNSPGPRTYTDLSFTLSATSDSGLPVSFVLVSGPATVSGNTVNLGTTRGTVVIRASQDGNAMYAPAANVDQSFLLVGRPELTNDGGPIPAGTGKKGSGCGF